LKSEKSLRLFDLIEFPSGTPLRLGLLFEEFQYVRFLGKGAQGSVHLLRPTKGYGELIVAKIAEEDSASQAAIVNELRIYPILGSLVMPLRGILMREVRIFGFTTCHEHGQTLADLLLNGPLAPEEAAPLAKTIIRAVLRLGVKQVLHRDLKPSHLFITLRGEVKFLDFGLSWDLKRDAGRSSSCTFAYASPEQVEKRDLDQKSDLFSLGLILYELVWGRMFFCNSTASYSEFLAYRKERLKAPIDLPERCPLWLGTLISRLIVEDPAERAGKREVGELLAASRFPRSAEKSAAFAPSIGSFVPQAACALAWIAGRSFGTRKVSQG
jgi:serine/threonine protein kinase